MPFDSARAILQDPDQFQRFNVTDDGVPLGEAKLKPKEVLLVLERGGSGGLCCNGKWCITMWLRANWPVSRIWFRSEWSATVASV
jgi:hypothetical protein